MPIWLQLAISIVLLSTFVRPPREESAAPPNTQRLRVDAKWRRFTAMESILAAQSRRFADADATLGVVALFELTAAFWFFDKAVSDGGNHGQIAIAVAMAAPILVAVAAMRCLGGKESPDAAEFYSGLDQDEELALERATEQMVEDFERNKAPLRAKEIGVNFSVALFAALLLANVLVHVV